jgi:hypothetical protein
VDVDGDGRQDLVELIDCGEGPEPDDLTWKTKVNVYLFKEKKLVLVSPDQAPPKSQESGDKAGPAGSESPDSKKNKDQGTDAPENEQPADQKSSPPRAIEKWMRK